MNYFGAEEEAEETTISPSISDGQGGQQYNFNSGAPPPTGGFKFGSN
jgi:hypothetical protein